MTANGDQGLWREEERRTEKGWFQPQKDQNPQPELHYMLCFIFSPVRAGFEGRLLKH